ncbi:glycosyl hydrolase [Paenibacillus caseinilyticus]|uniref:glycosyl hydrolase n=1 Tax=Paenibacillus caseinilyticus TaxID=3098138 RepID=UPI0022B8E969|nr:glycosyl hydrolase [Paenibacillus caseinilyticus]MCZ8519522.1 glycosyl hydrolase [Paenibacillus caseinilyticus]
MSRAEILRERFDRPPAECRSAPFWAWNDELREEEVLRQIGEMKEGGMGGFFIHSRDGLETEYMGAEWMKLVRSAVEEAEAQGMQAWLYDEDRWPSGFAGGFVQAKGGDAYRAKGLTLEVVRLEDAAAGRLDERLADGAPVAVFQAVIAGRSLLGCTRLDLQAAFAERVEAAAAAEYAELAKAKLPGTELPNAEPQKDQEQPSEDVYLIFRVEVSGRSEWFNGEAPPDHLNPDTVRTFIELTYEAYEREVGTKFGTVVRGVFTDEPSIHDRHCRFTAGRGWMPWSGSFPDFYRERRGSDVLDTAPYLFFDGSLSPQARHDYWRTVTERFSESFSGQIGEWCGDRGLAFTGHYLWENNLGTATRVCGAVMPNYRYQHVPGIDMLGEQTNETITVKQCTSVAHQYGRPVVLSETYGCTGWGFTFEGQRWVGDFQYALGVNLRSQHLALYSIKGCRKRDYPPVFHYNTSWWKYSRVIEDYYARLSAVLTEGQPVRDVLVLHPSTTAWSMVGTGPYGFPARGKDRDVSSANRYGHEFNAFLRGLLGAHYDFDLGDEIILSEIGSVRETENTVKLAVGQAAYRVVVLPEIRSMLRSTFGLLTGFLEAGGRVIAVGEPAAMLEGRPAPELSRLYGHPGLTLVPDGGAAAAALGQSLPRRVSMTHRAPGSPEAPELLYMLREAEDGRTLFVVNNDRESSHQVRITLEGEGRLEEWNALTGEVTEVPVRHGRDGRLEFDADFGPADSKLYVLHTNCEAQAVPTAVPASLAHGLIEAPGITCIELRAPASFERTAPNALTLDVCSYRLGEREWSEEMDVWRAQRAVREALGMRQVYGNGLEQRYRWVHELHPGDGTPAAFRFVLEVTDIPEGAVHLVVESAREYEIRLNGVRIPAEPDGWFLDRSFDRVPLGALRQGRNELVLLCRYHQRMEVEDLYLIGDFGVDDARRIIREPAALQLGDWCLQGYPHYAGSMVYRFPVDGGPFPSGPAWLELRRFEAVTAEVRINGETAGHVPWRAASRIDISGSLVEGENHIEVEVMGSPRNLLGPFHHTAADPSITSWASFRKEGDGYSPAYELRPYGLLDGIRLYRAQEQGGKGG